MEMIKQFFLNLPTTWWGVTIIVLASLIACLLLFMLLYRQFFKRFFDIVLSGFALIVFSPILLILAILVKTKLGSPIIFKQYRPGKKGKIFAMKKFRTMTSEKDENGNLLPDEQRLTKFGKFLRSTSLDELPEIWNIFLGQMSIIGPRPQLVRDLVFMNEEIDSRHKVRGGLTGLAQVSGRNNLTWQQRFDYDLMYVNKITFWQDLKIFFKTIGKVFLRSDVATEGMATSEDYGDYLLRTEQISLGEYNEKIQHSKMLLEAKKQKNGRKTI